MTSTHALVGAGLGAGVAAVSPGLAAGAVAAGFVGGLVPDADLLATHRRTCHFPVLLPVVAGCLLGLGLALGSSAVLLVATAAVAAAVHAVMDAYCGGVECRPWEATSERAVYDHVAGRWIAPRRWVRYAGAPEDLLLAGGAALPALVATEGPLRAGLLAVLLGSTGFVLVRRRLAPLSERLFGDPGEPGAE